MRYSIEQLYAIDEVINPAVAMLAGKSKDKSKPTLKTYLNKTQLSSLERENWHLEIEWNRPLDTYGVRIYNQDPATSINQPPDCYLVKTSEKWTEKSGLKWQVYFHLAQNTKGNPSIEGNWARVKRYMKTTLI